MISITPFTESHSENGAKYFQHVSYNGKSKKGIYQSFVLKFQYIQIFQLT